MTRDDHDQSVSTDAGAKEETAAGADQPSDPSADPDPTSDADDGSVGRSDTGTEPSSREVEVPMRVYKAVTVFTTLFAVMTVVGGFVVLDSATNRATASVSEIQPIAALVGIGLILAGAAAYAFSTRFRATGMGKSKDDTAEHSDNG